jgi:hypothetical protein
MAPGWNLIRGAHRSLQTGIRRRQGDQGPCHPQTSDALTPSRSGVRDGRRVVLARTRAVYDGDPEIELSSVSIPRIVDPRTRLSHSATEHEAIAVGDRSGAGPVHAAVP